MRIPANPFIRYPIVIVALAGSFLGNLFRTNAPSTSIPEVFANVNLPLGSDFPNIPLLSEEYVDVLTGDIIGHDGAIILFMEIGCSPCEVMNGKWQEAINSGIIRNNQVIGITYNEPEYISVFHDNYNLTFPIYSDTGAVFMNRYNVVGFPYAVAVDKDKKIALTNFDARKEIGEYDLDLLFNKQ